MRQQLLAMTAFVFGLVLGLAVSPVGSNPLRAPEPVPDEQARCDDAVDGRTRVELVMTEPAGPDEAIVDAEFLLDGTPLLPVEAPVAQCGRRAVVRAVAPGEHVLSVRVRYRRDVRVLTRPEGATRLTMTVFPGGEFDLRKTLPVTVSEGETLRLAGSVQLVAGSPADRLVLAPLQDLLELRDMRARQD